MNIVIVGAGKVGGTLVETFIKEDHNIIVIDTDGKIVESVVNKYDVNGIIGSGCEHDNLVSANIERADFFIAATSRDEVNILSCVLAKSLGAKHTAARVRDPEYFKEINSIKHDLSVDMVFNPEYRTAKEISSILQFPSALSVESFGNGRASMVEFLIESDNYMVGKTIQEIVKEYKCNVLFAIVKRNERAHIPHGNFRIEKGDIVHVIGSEVELASFCKRVHLFKPKAKTVCIIGGGKIGYYLAKMLLDSGVSVKIIDNDEARCKELAEELYGATVLFGDATEQEVIEEEQVDKNDACVVLTGMDEENVIISMYIKQLGMEKVITEVDRPSVRKMVKMFGLDTIVSPRYVIANHVLRFVRSRQADFGLGVNTLYKLYDKIEALEFTATESFNGLKTTLKELKLKPNVLIGGIVRGEEFIIPSGESTILLGDKVIVIATAKQIAELSEILD